MFGAAWCTAEVSGCLSLARTAAAAVLGQHGAPRGPRRRRGLGGPARRRRRAGALRLLDGDRHAAGAEPLPEPGGAPDELGHPLRRLRHGLALQWHAPARGRARAALHGAAGVVERRLLHLLRVYERRVHRLLQRGRRPRGGRRPRDRLDRRREQHVPGLGRRRAVPRLLRHRPRHGPPEGPAQRHRLRPAAARLVHDARRAAGRRRDGRVLVELDLPRLDAVGDAVPPAGQRLLPVDGPLHGALLVAPLRAGRLPGRRLHGAAPRRARPRLPDRARRLRRRRRARLRARAADGARRAELHPELDAALGPDVRGVEAAGALLRRRGPSRRADQSVRRLPRRAEFVDQRHGRPRRGRGLFLRDDSHHR